MKYSYIEYQIILFDLSNILPSFQIYIINILSKKLNIFIIIYLNDILIYTKKPS